MEDSPRADSKILSSADAALAVHNQADDFGGAKVSSPLRSREFPGLVGREDAPLALYLVKAGTRSWDAGAFLFDKTCDMDYHKTTKYIGNFLFRISLKKE